MVRQAHLIDVQARGYERRCMSYTVSGGGLSDKFAEVSAEEEVVRELRSRSPSSAERTVQARSGMPS